MRSRIAPDAPQNPLPRCVLRITNSFSLKQALALVDVKVLDHFVVAGTSTVSFAERGLV
jgi:DNA repair protein RadC